jgi:diguanylate cyclase (GGDEF)-like protein/PAS domain S-box-containing protein
MISKARLLLGAGLTLVGVGIVEGLLVAGMPPLGPVGWPGLGALAGTALGGAAGLAGGALVLVAYFGVNLLLPGRFPEFFSHPHNTVSWLLALALVAGAILAARPRLLRAAAAEAELSARRTYEEALRESEARLRIITDNLPALVSYIDAQERYRFNNRAYEEWLGMPRAEMAGRRVRDIWGEEVYARLKPSIERALRGERVSYEYAANEGGTERHVLASYVPDFDGAGRVKGFFVLGSDITQLAAARRELAAEHERLEAALDGSSVALWDTDLRAGRVYLSEAWAEMLGDPLPAATVTSLAELVSLLHPDDVAAVRAASVAVLKDACPLYAVEHRVRARNGEWKWVLSRGRVTQRDQQTGRALRMIGTNFDITDRRRMEEAVQSAAQSDPLTGLANRALLAERLRHGLARAPRGAQIAVLYVDIDRFKQINDRLGHAGGDAVLVHFAARLRSSVRATDTVARFGGDEFVVLLDDVKEREHAVRIAEKIVAECRLPLRIDGDDVVATASLGLAFGAAPVDGDSLLRLADAALYEAKSAGRDGYRIAA